MKCNVCNNSLDKLIYDPQNKISLTSLCRLHAGSIQIYACEACGHLQTNEMEDLESYYSESYRILLNSEEEDQIYKIIDGKPLYRTAHQVNTLFSKLGINADHPPKTDTFSTHQPSQRILDYGCAKSSTMKQLSHHGIDAQIYLFDVSDMYVSYWRSFLPDSQWATYQIPTDWLGTFDFVTSFFALEHIADLQLSLNQIKSCLKVGGTFYFIVPNTFTNPSDFIVADHVNHFTSASIQYLLSHNGFIDIDIDDQAHFGAFIVTARLASTMDNNLLVEAQEISLVLQQGQAMANYWSALSDKIRTFEAAHLNKSGVIYGSGVYGSFILSALQNTQNIRYFIDRSPFQQGQKIFDKQVIAPQEIDADVETMYIGLNPQIAKKAISEVEAFKSLNCEYLFL